LHNLENKEKKIRAGSGELMNVQHRQVRILVLFLTMVAVVSCANAQTQEDKAQTQKASPSRVKRRQALDLFEQGKRLEALPLLEELSQLNPKDDELLVDLAACLVRHAATLDDQQAAANERFRAKKLVQQALDLGNTSPLAQNLHQLLGQLPANGEIKFSDNPSIEQAMVAGEAAFSRRDFPEALKNYAKALELDPRNYPAVLFTGNTYHRQNDFAKAAEWYQRAIQLDPNVETAYRYYAEMLVKRGDMAKARTMFIQAAVAEPYNRMVWRDLWGWAGLNQTKLDFAYAGVLPEPKEPRPQIDEPLFKVEVFPPRPRNLSDASRAYHSVRSAWKDGGRFKRHFPEEADYRHSLAEETDALNAEIRSLESLTRDIDTAELVNENGSLRLLLKFHESGVLEPYVLFRLADEGIAKDYSAYRAEHRDKLEEYLDKFVVPPAPAKAESGPEKTKPDAVKSSGPAKFPQAHITK
jgi:Flp pilus assembly protein TadD